MPLSSRMTRAARSALVLSTAALAVFGLAACKTAGPLVVGQSSSAADAPAGSSTVSAAGSPADAAKVAAARAAARAASRAQRVALALARSRAAAGSATNSPGSTTNSPGSTDGSGAPVEQGVSAPGAGQATTGDLMYIGSVDGGYQQALAGTGVGLADHSYAFFTAKNVPQTAMVTVSAANTPWRDVAAAGPGSALYDDIVRWAQTIKARGTNVMVAYNHEPEGHDRLQLGSAVDFINAYRHVESIFTQQGATNVVWTWQMTAYAFRVNPASDQAAAKWYPGDAWIDNVGADAYNWYTCGSIGTGQYNELQQIGDPVLAFARAHGKAASFPEFASHANANRVQWLNNAQQYFINNQDVLAAAFYFNRPPTVAANADCKWGLTSSSEYGALRQMALDKAHFKV
jgi:hypothetical protein